MDAISGINLGFSVKLGNMNYDLIKNSSPPETPATQEPNSFLSILNLLDADADGKIDTQELKFGAGFMINSLIYSRDQDGDLLLSAEEAGVPVGHINPLDTDSDQKLSAREMITPADKIIEGLVPLLDTDGDKVLSREELAIFELLFNNLTSTAAKPEPDTDTLFKHSLSSGGEKLELDTNSIPDAMRQAGFQGTDNQLYYVLASTYADLPWGADPTDPATIKLSDQRGEIYEWFDKMVINVADKMEADPNLSVTAISNDGPDRCGSRLGTAIMEKLKKFGDRA